MKTKNEQNVLNVLYIFTTHRETMLQALRGVIGGAGKKMGEAVRKALTATLISLLGMQEVGQRLYIIRPGKKMSWLL